ncbi:MAG TPA: type II toxin-antitoxin system prevent-host-death family antitoxin [Caulobacteraceae bacterium]|jgi:prevent-host-death family protein|nr:type II toxin-antitoxin system prevent-host-death family antitoxin [Caulobacteraceae bacterium]
MIVKMHEAKSQLSRLVAAALSGEEVIIARGSEPLVRLTPIQPVRTKRTPGRYKGMFSVPDGFFDPLSEEELALWEDGPVGDGAP